MLFLRNVAGSTPLFFKNLDTLFLKSSVSGIEALLSNNSWYSNPNNSASKANWLKLVFNFPSSIFAILDWPIPVDKWTCSCDKSAASL